MKTETKNYIAILDGDSYDNDYSQVRLVSTSTGLVEKEVDLSDFKVHSGYKEVHSFEHFGEPFVVYDRCVKPRYEVDEMVENISSVYPKFSDKECTKPAKLVSPYSPLDDVRVLSITPVDSHMKELFGERKKVFTWEIKLQYAIRHSQYEKVWYYSEPEEDYFYERMKKDYNLELPEEIRKEMDVREVIKMIADKLNINLLNII